MRNPIPIILVTSISKKVPLIRELKIALMKINPDCLVVGADSDKHCIAAYFVDHFWHMPDIEDLTDELLIDKLVALKVTGIIPSRDGELTFFASKIDLLSSYKIQLMLPRSDCVATCLDKLKFSETLINRDFPAIQSLPNIEGLAVENYVVKEQYGAGSKTILINAKKLEALEHAMTLSAAIFQPYIAGDEYSVDVFFTAQSIFKGAVVRRREMVVKGESQVTTTVNHQSMEQLCENVGAFLQLRGHAVFQIVESQNGKLHIIELNSRFGGASSLSIAAGLDSFYWFALESIGINITNYEFHRCNGQLRQVRYAADKLIAL